MNLKDKVEQCCKESVLAKNTTTAIYSDHIVKLSTKIADCIMGGRKVLLFGNGGSAADCQHIAAEFVGKFQKLRPSIPAISLTTDTSILTAVGNDYGFEDIFSRQIDGLGQMGDVAIAISTSGYSPNVQNGIDKCREKRIYVAGFTGLGGGFMSGVCDVCFQVASTVTPRIQETHIFLLHMVCELVDDILYPEVQ